MKHESQPDHDHHDDHEHGIYDLGLQADFQQWTRAPVDRRRALRLGLVGLGTLLGGAQVASALANAAASSAAACVPKIPSETAGPFPGDGSNGANALTKSGIVRSDIRTSLGTKNVAAGVPTTLELTLVDSSNACAPLIGHAIYLWHCDRDGQYSMYSQGVTGEDYLRGVQATDSNGKAVFKTIFPACYAGRWPHVHFEIYPLIAKATDTKNKIQTSQLALPEAVCKGVYSSVTGYSQSARNLSQITLASDNVFRDGSGSQMATVTGNATAGYKASLTIGV
jgi:protocatechuate 3,4-dioxygenase beta subunit